MNNNRELMNRIKKYQNICIYGHISPDGDCYGAQSAMKVFLQRTLKKAEDLIIKNTYKELSIQKC